MKTRSSCALARGLCAAVLLLAPSIHAQSAEEQAAAQALFDEAKTLAKAGKFSEACPKFAESDRLDPGIGTKFNLADCNEQLGRIASAWSGFLQVAASAKTSGQPDREAVARQRATALEPRLSRLVIKVHVPSRIPGLTVHHEEALVGEAQWGTPIPVDIGDHWVTATAPGRKAWRADVTVTRDAEVINVDVPLLEMQAAETQPQPPPAIPVAPLAPSPRADQPPAADGTTQRMVALGLAGLGVVGLGVGTVMALGAKSDNDDSKAFCDRPAGSTIDLCDPQGLELRDDALAKGNIASVLFVGSAVVLGASAVLWFTAPHATERVSSVRVSAIAGSAGAARRLLPSAAISVEGTW